MNPVFKLVTTALAAIKRSAAPASLPRPDAGAWSPQLLKRLEWRRFEELCAACLEVEGYTARIARTAADGVVDIHLSEAGADKPGTPDQPEQTDTTEPVTVGAEQ